MSDCRHPYAGDVRVGTPIKLNEGHHRIPIIFITAQGDEKMRIQALRAGAVEFLTKSFDDEVLVAHLRAALHR